MYIEPNSKIYILKNVPLDTTYEHTVYFDTLEEQYEYFLSKAKYTLTEQTYQRVNRGWMRVQYKADDLYDCNYCMFQNTSFGNKWFYAFIKSVEYVNNITAEIEFEIDVMQTWHFDYTLGQCLVEREHTISDKIGENLVPENLEIGDYIEEPNAYLPNNNLAIIVGATVDKDLKNFSGEIISGLFSGVYYNIFPNTPEGADLAVKFINAAIVLKEGQEQVITGVYLAPAMPGDESRTEATERNILLDKIYGITRSTGLPPRNNKLFTFPYTGLMVTNLCGTSTIYKWEYFSGTSAAEFKSISTFGGSPSEMVVPMNYLGQPTNYNEALINTNYPQLPWSNDAFAAWLAMNTTNFAAGAINTAVTLGTGSMQLNETYRNIDANRGHQSRRVTTHQEQMADIQTAQTIGSGITGAVNLLASVVQHSMMPNTPHMGSDASPFAAIKQLGFHYIIKHIRPEFVDIIDDFFTMYGYSCHRVKAPNRHVRERWTYTKTINCVIHGSVPCDDMNKITNIYNSGITFWVKTAEIGDYSYSNLPIQEAS